MKLDENTRLQMILEAVLYCQRVRDMGMPATCYSKALREPIYFLWEAYGVSKKDAAKRHSKNTVGVEYGSRELVYDHSIPFRIIKDRLLELNEPTIETIREILESYCHACLITKEEDNKLNKLGLNNKMPADWDGLNPYARYETAGIELI